MQEHEIDLKKCVMFSSDGARGFTGKHNSVVAKVRSPSSGDLNKDPSSTHLFSKNLGESRYW